MITQKITRSLAMAGMAVIAAVGLSGCASNPTKPADTTYWEDVEFPQDHYPKLSRANNLLRLCNRNLRIKDTPIGEPLDDDWNWDVGAEFRISIKKPGLQGLRP